MTRWKQTCTCPACGHSAWREVETDDFAPAPDPAQLSTQTRCTLCGHRPCTMAQEQLLPRHFDQMRPGGLRWGLVDFGDSAARDAEIAAAIERAKVPTPGAETYSEMRERMSRPIAVPPYKMRRRRR